MISGQIQFNYLTYIRLMLEENLKTDLHKKWKKKRSQEKLESVATQDQMRKHWMQNFWAPLK